MSSALGINNGGQVVGYSEASAGERHAFLWTAVRGIADLGTLGGPESIARDINDHGQIVGESLTTSGARRATLWTSDTPTRAARALL
jgi:probable HAF family extracellular repeat protein